MDKEKNKKFLFQEYLVNCEDAIDKNIMPANGRLYRLVHNPTIDKDLKPTSLWKFKSPGKSIDEEFDSIIPKGSSIEDQETQLADYLPSFNLTDLGAVAPFLDRYKKKTPEQRKQFLANKGEIVVAYDVTPADGRWWAQKNGHVLFQPYEGFKLDEHVAADFKYKHLDDYLNEQDE